MKRILIAASLILAASSCLAAQESGNVVFAQAGPAGPVPARIATFQMKPPAPVVGAPYSATTTTQSVQTLSDGNRIVQNFTGSTARDSQGRTRQDAPLPSFGDLSATNAPHVVFIQDPVSQISYTLNLTEKTAQRMSTPMPPPPPNGDASPLPSSAAVPAAGAGKVVIQMQAEGPGASALPPPMAIAGMIAGDETAQAKIDDLGSQTMEGVLVNGTRTTRTIPAGQIGNEQPINIVTEIWTSPDLKTVVYSKHSDPRTGEQTFQLTNIVRAEPDPSLFTVPSDFTIVDGPRPILYRANQ